MKSLRIFLRLIRFPNIFTALSNIWAGGFIAGDGRPELVHLILASVSSAGLYAGGVTFNDYADREFDKRHRPERPIPAGLVRPSRAVLMTIILWLIGLVGGFALSFYAGLISTGIIICAFLYNAHLKKYLITASLFMGLCRGLNWLLGLAAGGPLAGRLLFLPLIILIYTAGLTLVAWSEDKNSRIKRLIRVGIIAIPLLDALIVAGAGLVGPSLMVLGLIGPTWLFSKLFEVT